MYSSSKWFMLLIYTLLSFVNVSCKITRSNNGVIESQSLKPDQHADVEIDRLRAILYNNNPQTASGNHALSTVALLNQEEVPDYWRRLGLLLQTKDSLGHIGGGVLQPEAITAFDEALRTDSGRNLALAIQVHQQKGILLTSMGRGAEAVDEHNQVFELSVGNTDRSHALFHKAAALSLLGRPLDAAVAYRKSLELTPNHLHVYLSLVICYKEVKGHLTKAQWGTLLKEIKLAVKKWKAGELQDNDDIRLGMSVLGSSETARGTFDSSVFWALYETAEMAGFRAESWEYLSEAHRVDKRNKLKQSTIEAVHNQALQIKSIFQPDFWIDGIGVESVTPVFIIGMMRSGSTLLETMLNAHQEIWGMGENSIFNGNLPQFRDALVKKLTPATKIYEDEDGIMTSREEVDMKGLRAFVVDHGLFILDAMKAEAYNSSSHSHSDLQRTRLPFRRVVDKMLFNYRNIGFINMVFPNAVILHMVRDPMDTMLSCFTHKFDDHGLEWAVDEEELANQYAVYLEIMQHFRTVLPGRVMDIKYVKKYIYYYYYYY